MPIRISPVLFLPALLAASLLTGCASLPPLEGRVPSAVITDTAQTTLGRKFEPEVQAQSPNSAIYALSNPRLAFAARAVLARKAERTLDVQYYIWHADTTGMLLLEELYHAAERGVRVRLLLDDTNTGGMDGILAALDAHPNIEVRLFNPFVYRTHRLWGYMTDFSRLNRRMHNKSLTADNQATIVGGRNIGNEYFGTGEETDFADLDVLAAGPVVSEVSAEFQLYWDCGSAYPASLVIGPTPATAVADLQAKFAEVRNSPAAINYLAAIERNQLAKDLEGSTLPVEWAAASVVSDDPKKGLGQAVETDLLLHRMMAAHGRAEHTLDLISPYFVPGKKGTDELVGMSTGGIKVRILTNSLSATDVGAVHSGYAKRREDLLRGGVELYELKPDANDPKPGDKSEDKPTAYGGSSGVSLHAKTFAADGKRVFVGSFNLDPRSYKLNTELGLVIESPALAVALSNVFNNKVATKAYTVKLDQDGHDLIWVEHTPTGDVLYTNDPHTSFWRRFGVGFMSILPIEWLL